MKQQRFSIKQFAPIWMAIMIDSMGYALVYPIMTLIFTNTQHPILPPGTTAGLRHFYLGLGYLLYPLAMFFGGSFMGDLSDRWGRKKVLLFSILGLALSFFLMGWGTYIESLSLLFLGRILSGLFAGSQPTAQAAISDMSRPEEKKWNLNFMTFVISFGIVLGPIFGGFFADSNIFFLFSFSTPFFLAGGLCIGNALWIGGKFQETYFPQEKKGIDLYRPIKLFLETFQRKRVCFIALIFLLMQVGYAIFYQLIQVRLATQFNYSAWNLGMFNGALGISFVLAIFLNLKYFLKAFHENLIALLSLLFTGLGLIGVALVEKQIFVIFFSLIASACDMIAYGMMMTAFSHTQGPKSQGWVMGIFAATLALSWTIAGFATNLLTFISANEIIAIGGMSMLLSALLMNFYAKKYQKINR